MRWTRASGVRSSPLTGCSAITSTKAASMIRTRLESRQAPLGACVISVPDTAGIRCTLMSAIDAGLKRTTEDTIKVLRHASQPLGPMGAEWLERQEQEPRGSKWRLIVVV